MALYFEEKKSSGKLLPLFLLVSLAFCMILVVLFLPNADRFENAQSIPESQTAQLSSKTFSTIQLFEEIFNDLPAEAILPAAVDLIPPENSASEPTLPLKTPPQA